MTPQAQKSGLSQEYFALPSQNTPTDQSGTDRTAMLLNLLNFNSPSSSSNSPAQQQSVETPSYPSYNKPQVPTFTTEKVTSRGVSASDLSASFTNIGSASPAREGSHPVFPKPKSDAPPTPTSNPQDYLLQLLNRSKSGQVSQPPLQSQPSLEMSQVQLGIENKAVEDIANTSTGKGRVTKISQMDPGSSSRNNSPIRIFGSDSRETTPFEPQDMPKVEVSKEPIFTYVNPFDHLAASSPRNIKSRSGNATPLGEPLQPTVLTKTGDSHKRSIKESLARPGAEKSRKLTPGGHEVLQSIESTGASIERRGMIGDLVDIGVPTKDPKTAARALNEVSEPVSRQADAALAEADQDGNEDAIKQEEHDEVDLEKRLQETAIEVKQEPVQEGANTLETVLPGSWARAVKQAIDEAAAGDGDGDGQETLENSQAIRVFNFPMRPFVSIDLTQEHPPDLYLREDAIADVARFKKEFDQIDRTLVTASHEFIAYALPKAGGVRVIRQEDGMDRKYFKETRDRVFNVTISTVPSGKSALEGLQGFIATSISGAVYWVAISHIGRDSIDDEQGNQEVLTFPPVPSHDENTSGGQLKTRAKKSSRHPEFFAIGRGKLIQIVFPLHAHGSNFVDSSSVVDTEKYFKDRTLKIDTGKAGKDFNFSEDDTVIATLDKAGRLRFWDIRELVEVSHNSDEPIAPVEIRTPVLTFLTANPSEKSWPTSVIFVDKARPYAKGVALRYVIVGLKQNHAIQLWDLGLGKAVQELNFPHEKESDAICSVCYHAPSGLIVVGHPTRNSIYFIHLSAPKYNLPSMSQAKFIQRLASKDATLPKPEATAIMSGMREYSFSSKDQLRSIDLLPSKESDKMGDLVEDPTLFELYVMHSKGVICMNIKRGDLGWNQDSRVINPIDAEKYGCIKVKDLRDPAPAAMSEPSSVNGDAAPRAPAAPIVAPKGVFKESAKKPVNGTVVDSKAKAVGETSDGSTPFDPFVTNNTSKASNEPSAKKKKNKQPLQIAERLSDIPPQAPVPPNPTSYANAAQRATTPNVHRSAKSGSVEIPEFSAASKEIKSKRGAINPETISVGISSEFLDKEFKKVEEIMSAEFSRVLNQKLGDLYRRFDDDKRVHDAAGAAKQDAILRLVSNTLTENVEKALSRIVNTSIQQEVVPSIADITASTVSQKVGEWLSQHISSNLPTQLKLAIPEGVTRALQHPEVFRTLSEQVTQKVAVQVERQFSSMLVQTVAPAFQSLAVGAAQRMSAETERRVAEQLKLAELKSRDDSAKIDQLTTLVRGLSETVHSMAAAQSQFQSEILRLQQQNIQQSSAGSAAAPAGSNKSSVSPERQELDIVTDLMKQGRFEEGTIHVSICSHMVCFKSRLTPLVDSIAATSRAFR
jgi:macrodomain Ter protein organizer (MatP/YcbG family)